MNNFPVALEICLSRLWFLLVGLFCPAFVILYILSSQAASRMEIAIAFKCSLLCCMLNVFPSSCWAYDMDETFQIGDDLIKRGYTFVFLVRIACGWNCFPNSICCCSRVSVKLSSRDVFILFLFTEQRVRWGHLRQSFLSVIVFAGRCSKCVWLEEKLVHTLYRHHRGCMNGSL